MSNELRGLNLANLSDQLVYYGHFGNKRLRPCVFLCHKREDKSACKILADQLSINHIDYYLDEEDQDLQLACAEKNPYTITEAIKKGIVNSTHMAVIISDKTYKSEWVPFEVGYGHAAIIDKGLVLDQRAAREKLVIIVLKDLNGRVLPDYLQVGFEIKSIEDFIQYIAHLKGNHFGFGTLNHIALKERSQSDSKGINTILL